MISASSLTPTTPRRGGCWIRSSLVYTASLRLTWGYNTGDLVSNKTIRLSCFSNHQCCPHSTVLLELPSLPYSSRC